MRWVKYNHSAQINNILLYSDWTAQYDVLWDQFLYVSMTYGCMSVWLYKDIYFNVTQIWHKNVSRHNLREI